MPGPNLAIQHVQPADCKVPTSQLVQFWSLTAGLLPYGQSCFRCPYAYAGNAVTCSLICEDTCNFYLQETAGEQLMLTVRRLISSMKCCLYVLNVIVIVDRCSA